jgi:16S rRNA processing protein RimM
VVGRVRGVHGLRGAVRVEPLTDSPERFTVGSRLHREGSDAPLTIAWAQPDGPGYLLRFREITDREGADTLRDVYLEAEASRHLQPGEYYWHEVVGLTARTSCGEELGTVHEVFRAGGAEVYVVRGGWRGEVLVPAVRGIVLQLDPSGAGLVVDAEALALPPPRERRRRGRRSSKGGATPSGPPFEGPAVGLPKDNPPSPAMGGPEPCSA